MPVTFDAVFNEAVVMLVVEMGNHPASLHAVGIRTLTADTRISKLTRADSGTRQNHI